MLVEAVRAPDDDPTKRSVTIAGDTAQRLVFDNNFTRLGRAARTHRPGQPAIVRPLKLSYRSTAEVMLLAREILGPELAPDEPLAARPGEPVELHEFGDLGEAVAFLGDALRNLMAREPTASCAVISRHPEQADAYFEGLRRAEVPALRRVRRDEFNFQPGVDVTDVAQVKGLEFDYVVMVDVNAASYPDSHWARHLLHIGVTRAAHQLWLVSTGEPSPLDPDRAARRRPHDRRLTAAPRLPCDSRATLRARPAHTLRAHARDRHAACSFRCRMRWLRPRPPGRVSHARRPARGVLDRAGRRLGRRRYARDAPRQRLLRRRHRHDRRRAVHRGEAADDHLTCTTGDRHFQEGAADVVVTDGAERVARRRLHVRVHVDDEQRPQELRRGAAGQGARAGRRDLDDAERARQRVRREPRRR